MPEVATTGSESAPLTRIRRLPRYISRAIMGSSPPSLTAPAVQGRHARNTWSSRGTLLQRAPRRQSLAPLQQQARRPRRGP
eukprot:3921882-Amphidinium_carterae.1